MPLIAADPTDKSPPILAVLHPSETLLKYHNGTLSQLSSSPNAQSITMEHPSKVTALATSIDGKLVAFGYTDGSVILHSFPDAGDNGANHPMFDDPDEDAYDSLLTQNDGLSDSEDDADTPSRKTIYNGPKLDGNITSLLFLNTRYLAIASSSPHAGHSICVVDASTPATLLETGKLLGDFTVGEGVASVAYNKNVLSCLTTDGRLVCFKCPLDAEDPELEWEELDATRTTVGCGNVSMGYERTSGVVLAAVSSGREEGTVGVYKVGSDGGDAEEGCLNKTEEKGLILDGKLGHDGPVACVGFVGEGEGVVQVVTCGKRDGKVILWDVKVPEKGPPTGTFHRVLYTNLLSPPIQLLLAATNTRTVIKSYTDTNTKPVLAVGIALLDGQILHVTGHVGRTLKNVFPVIEEVVEEEVEVVEAQTQDYDAEDLVADQDDDEEEEPLGSQPMDSLAQLESQPDPDSQPEPEPEPVRSPKSRKRNKTKRSRKNRETEPESQPEPEPEPEVLSPVKSRKRLTKRSGSRSARKARETEDSDDDLFEQIDSQEAIDVDNDVHVLPKQDEIVDVEAPPTEPEDDPASQGNTHPMVDDECDEEEPQSQPGTQMQTQPNTQPLSLHSQDFLSTQPTSNTAATAASSDSFAHGDDDDDDDLEPQSQQLEPQSQQLEPRSQPEPSVDVDFGDGDDNEDADLDEAFGSNDALTYRPPIPPAPPRQEPFLPSSTPVTTSSPHRILCWNHEGTLTHHSSDTSDDDHSSVDIRFVDSATRRSIRFVDDLNLVMGTMGSQGAFFASDVQTEDEPEEDEDVEDVTAGLQLSATLKHIVRSQHRKNSRPNSTSRTQNSGSTLYYHRYESTLGQKEKDWTLVLPTGERATGVATGDHWSAVTTSRNLVRLFSGGGVQTGIHYLPGEVLTLVGRGRYCAIVHHDSGNSGGIGLMLVDVLQSKLLHAGPLTALTPATTLSWVGFSNEAAFCCLTSSGILSMLHQSGFGGWVFTPMLDTRGRIESTTVGGGSSTTHDGNYWPVTVTGGKCLCLPLPPGTEFPDAVKRPLVLGLPLRCPMAQSTINTSSSNPSANQTQTLEELSIRATISLHHSHFVNTAELKSNDTSEEEEVQREYHQLCAKVDKIGIKLFYEAVQAQRVERALDLVRGLHLEKSYGICLSVCEQARMMRLGEAIEGLREDKFRVEEDGDGTEEDSGYESQEPRRSIGRDMEEEGEGSPDASRVSPDVHTLSHSRNKPGIKRRLSSSRDATNTPSTLSKPKGRGANPFAVLQKSPGKKPRLTPTPTARLAPLARTSTFSAQSRQRVRSHKHIL